MFIINHTDFDHSSLRKTVLKIKCFGIPHFPRKPDVFLYLLTVKSIVTSSYLKVGLGKLKAGMISAVIMLCLKKKGICQNLCF